MDLFPNETEQEITDAAHKMLARLCTMDRVRAAHDSEDGLVREVWDGAVEQGWFLLAAPEADGGLGAGVHQAAMIMEAVGASLAPGPWIGTLLAGAFLGQSEIGVSARAGALVALGFDRRDVAAPARFPGGAAQGLCPRVHYVSAAAHVLVADDQRLWSVKPADMSPLGAMDPGLRMGSLDLSQCEAKPLDLDRQKAFDFVDIMAGAQAVGVAEGALQLGVNYAKLREQFGKPIGAFQALKHRMADMAARVEQARALVMYAAVGLSEGAIDPGLAGSAWRLAVVNARANARDAVLIHGAIGFTWECDAHLFLKRAHTLGEIRMDLDDPLDAVIAREIERSSA